MSPRWAALGCALLALAAPLPARADACRRAVSDAIAAWRELAVSVPALAGSADMSRIVDTVDQIHAHGVAERALSEARRRRQRAGLPAALDLADDWLAHAEVRDAGPAQAALAAARAACP